MVTNFIVFNLLLYYHFSLRLSSYFAKRMIFGALIFFLPNSMILHLAFTHPHPPLCPQNVRAEFTVLDPGEDAFGHQNAKETKMRSDSI